MAGTDRESEAVADGIHAESNNTECSIPILDLRDPDAAPKLAAMCRDVGFFYLEGHGLSPDYIDSVFEASKGLFELPLEEKTKLSDKVTSRGYTAMQEEKLDPPNQKEGDTKEGYYIGREIPVEDPRYNPAKLRGPNQWPEVSELPNFRPVMEDYHSRATALAMRVVQLIAVGLGLEESYFDSDFGERCVRQWFAMIDHSVPQQAARLAYFRGIGAIVDSDAFMVVPSAAVSVAVSAAVAVSFYAPRLNDIAHSIA
eukprot:CAMPEP_0172361056 /NCGR_PEP_ID=MMETSP1060-20121228/4952_1 /TAXON_ID=37318 /ORGANISM="Pseudo-nitzschia pungens, Strain cf. cingulata" /LENGTH=255 /DNA_ID=CAMNT_0013083201 /DNA_START=441 /DNA_END=1207 /DNA_ORIENTATION=-